MGVRRPATVEIMLLSAICLWGVNFAVTRYVLTNGMRPLTYGTVRYGLAAAVFVVITLVFERSLYIARRDLLPLLSAGGLLFVNQLGFIYALKTTAASVIAMILATTPIFAALLALVLGMERLPRRFWGGAVLSIVGVGLVALGTGGALSGDLGGILCALLAGLSFAIYSMLIAPLMSRYSASRLSAVVFVAAVLPIALSGSRQTANQDWGLGWKVWALTLFAAIGAVVIPTVLWFHVIDRIGTSRATLATNLQPFVAVLFAVVLLHESIGLIQIAGGLLIGLGLLAARGRQVAVPVE